MADKFWKARDRRILWKWFGTKRIPSTGHKSPDGITDHEVLEIFQYNTPKQFEHEFRQAEREAGNEKIPWIIFGPKNGRDEEKFIATKLRYFPNFDYEKFERGSTSNQKEQRLGRDDS